MKEHQYICTLLSDVVISSRVATSGVNDSLDYIPGSKFLGIVAGNLYDEKNDSTLDLFHNGKVRFGDAQPYYEKERAEKIPFSWFHPKGKKLEDTIYLHQKMSQLDKETWAKDQPKQARKGYFTPKGKNQISSIQNFSIKSAYDRKTLKAKDQQMYGYFALSKGSTWAFIIEYETEQYIEEIKSILEGKHGIGRSRSAEYGLVDIKFDKEITPPNEDKSISGDILIYAASNLCFYDKYGRTTAQPTPGNLNLPEDTQIDWENSQIRSRVYQTWNRHRFNRDADRLIIEKGSVIAVKIKTSVSSTVFDNGIGAHRAEGFGRTLINPSFLNSNTPVLDFTLTQAKDWNQSSLDGIVETGENDEAVLAFLEQKKSSVQKIFTIDELVNTFIKDKASIFDGLNSSQWGMLRNYAKHSATTKAFEDLVFAKDFGCLNRGKSEKDWRKNGRKEKLYSFLFEDEKLEDDAIIPFTIKLASQMAKLKTNSK